MRPDHWAISMIAEAIGSLASVCERGEKNLRMRREAVIRS